MFQTLLRTALLTVLFALPAHAAPQAPAAAQPAPPPVPLLWKACDADNCVFLLGTFHMLKPTDYPLSSDITRAMADAERVAFEVSPREMQDQAAAAMLMGQLGVRRDGTALDDDLTPQQRARLAEWVKTNTPTLQKMGMPPQLLQMLEPWYAGLLITVVEFTKQGLDPKLGLDNHVMENEAVKGKPVAGLETLREQLGFFDDMDKPTQIAFLVDSLDDAAEPAEVIDRLHTAWRRGDARMLWTEMGEKMRTESPQLYARLLAERNARWMPKVEAMLAPAAGRDDTLLAVGALHLLGPDGLIEQLKAKGYTVERICSACTLQ